jgi:hypothetical protein
MYCRNKLRVVLTTVSVAKASYSAGCVRTSKISTHLMPVLMASCLYSTESIPAMYMRAYDAWIARSSDVRQRYVKPMWRLTFAQMIASSRLGCRTSGSSCRLLCMPLTLLCHADQTGSLSTMDRSGTTTPLPQISTTTSWSNRTTPPHSSTLTSHRSLPETLSVSMGAYNTACSQFPSRIASRKSSCLPVKGWVDSSA